MKIRMILAVLAATSFYSAPAMSFIYVCVAGHGCAWLEGGPCLLFYESSGPGDLCRDHASITMVRPGSYLVHHANGTASIDSGGMREPVMSDKLENFLKTRGRKNLSNDALRKELTVLSKPDDGKVSKSRLLQISKDLNIPIK